jgi:hypothetical protein
MSEQLKKAYLLIDEKNENIKLIDELQQVEKMKFESIDELSTIKIFEIEFKKKISFKPEVSIKIKE